MPMKPGISSIFSMVETGSGAPESGDAYTSRGSPSLASAMAR